MKGLSLFTLGAQSERTVRKTWNKEPEPRTSTLNLGLEQAGWASPAGLGHRALGLSIDFSLHNLKTLAPALRVGPEPRLAVSSLSPFPKED